MKRRTSVAFPGPLGPGPIEARCTSRARHPQPAFPGPLGPGPIEADLLMEVQSSRCIFPGPLGPGPIEARPCSRLLRDGCTHFRDRSVPAPLKRSTWPKGFAPADYFRDRSVPAPLKRDDTPTFDCDGAHFRDRSVPAPLKPSGRDGDRGAARISGTARSRPH